MKKLTAVMLTFVLLFCLSSLFVNAATDPNGFKFDIVAVDQKITAEKGLIITSEQALKDSGTGWSIIIHCGKVEGNVYTVKADTVAPTGEIPTIKMSAGDIIIAVHSATSDVAQKDQYPNVEQKLAALEVKKGMYFKLEGIDLAAKTVTNGKAICSKTKPAATTDPVSSATTESSAVEESSEPVQSVVSEAGNSSTVNTNSQTTSTTSDVSKASQESEMGTKGLEPLTIWLIVGCAAVVIGGISFAVVKSKKK